MAGRVSAARWRIPALAAPVEQEIRMIRRILPETD